MRYLVPSIIAFMAVAAFPGCAQERPPIVGVAHIGLKTDDLAASRQFYGHLLGFQEPFTIDKPTGGLMLTYFKVNDHQYIEVFPELKDEAEDRLSHICFETECPPITRLSGRPQRQGSGQPQTGARRQLQYHGGGSPMATTSNSWST